MKPVFKELNERGHCNQFAETVWKEPLTEREQQYINLYGTEF